MKLSKRLTTILLSTVILGCLTTPAAAANEETTGTAQVVENENGYTADTFDVLKEDKVVEQPLGTQEDIGIEKPDKPNEQIQGVGAYNGQKDIILGDVNLDSNIDIADVLLLQKSICKIVKLSEDAFSAARVTEQETVSIVDALALQKYIASGKKLEGSLKTIDRDPVAGAYVSSITLTAQTLAITTGGTKALGATVEPVEAGNKEVIWSSSDSEIATVDENGSVTAVAEGECTITCEATDGSGRREKCTIRVVNPVDSIVLNTNSIKWPVGRTGTYSPKLTPFTAKISDLTYTSSNSAVATVDKNGKLTAVSAGTCTITCAAADNSKIKDTCTVTVVVPVGQVKLKHSAASVEKGDTIALGASATPVNATNKAVSFSSSDNSIAKVSKDGVVTGVKKGTATITATAQDGYGATLSCKITVTESVSTGQQIADYAASRVGKTPYVWGGTSLTAGADCSGFVCAVYAEFGYDLWANRTSLSNVGKDISLSQAEPGDILVFYGHVGIYAGNGKVTHALNSNYGTLTTDISWGGTLKCVKRVV